MRLHTMECIALCNFSMVGTVECTIQRNYPAQQRCATYCSRGVLRISIQQARRSVFYLKVKCVRHRWAFDWGCRGSRPDNSCDLHRGNVFLCAAIIARSHPNIASTLRHKAGKYPSPLAPSPDFSRSSRSAAAASLSRLNNSSI